MPYTLTLTAQNFDYYNYAVIMMLYIRGTK